MNPSTFKILLEALKNSETKKINEIINKPDRKMVQNLLSYSDEINGDSKNKKKKKKKN